MPCSKNQFITKIIFMKRFIYGFLAISLAIGAAAFTAPKAPAAFTDAYFEFDYNNYDPTLANVVDESKWKRSADMNGCSNGDDRACKIRVSSAHYSGNTLLSSADIQALESDDDVAYVTQAEAVQIVNRANP